MVEKIVISCPNCSQPAHKEGNKVTCENCDAVFEIKKTGSAKVKQLGPIQEIQDRLAKIESAVFPPEEPEENIAEDDDEPEPEPEDREDSIL